MKRFREFYRQFEEIPPAGLSLELRARRADEKRRAVSRVEPLDLSGTAWHEPAHPEAVNAATFALRRALNSYLTPRQRSYARRSPRATARARPGRARPWRRRAAACRVGDAVASGRGRAGRLAGLAAAARAGRSRRRARGAGPGIGDADPRAHGQATRAVLLTGPADPTGAVLARSTLRELCVRLPEPVIAVVDEALGEFAPAHENAAGLVADAQPARRAVVLEGPCSGRPARGGGARPAALVGRLAPSGGIGAPAQAAALWALSERGQEIRGAPTRHGREAHARLATALAGSPLSAPLATVPFAWISSATEDGPAIAARLASQQVFVAPGRLWGDERHVRAALRGPAAVDRLVDALLQGA